MAQEQVVTVVDSNTVKITQSGKEKVYTKEELLQNKAILEQKIVAFDAWMAADRSALTSKLQKVEELIQMLE